MIMVFEINLKNWSITPQKSCLFSLMQHKIMVVLNIRGIQKYSETLWRLHIASVRLELL